MSDHYLHAYWRMPYIKSPREESGGKRNPFRALWDASDDRASLMIFRSQHSFVVLNKFPYNAGHLLVLPRREVGDPEDLSAEEYADLMQAVLRAKKLLRVAMAPDGFNVGFNLGAAAGAGIPTHLHAHIVPRWNGDTNFMPVIGSARVLPEALEVLWEKLRNHLADLS